MENVQEPVVIGPWWNYTFLLEWANEKRDAYGCLVAEAVVEDDSPEVIGVYAAEYVRYRDLSQRLTARYKVVRDDPARWIGWEATL